MRKLITMVGVAFILGLGGLSACGGGSSKSSTKTHTTSSARPTSTTTAKNATDADLQKLLLSVQDVPTGFSVDNSPKSNSTTSDLCGQKSLSDTVPHIGKAEISFLGGQYGPVLAETLTAYRTTDEATNAMKKARGVFKTCINFDQAQSDGTVMHWTLGELSFPKIWGDQIALRMSGKFDAGAMTADLVLARRSRVIALIGGISLTTILGGGQLQPGQFESTVRAALRKVKAAA